MRKMWNEVKPIERAAQVMEQIERYYALHPRSPSAVRRPRMSLRGELWVALLGPSLEAGIAGFGATIEAALRAFDVQYQMALQPPIKVESASPGAP